MTRILGAVAGAGRLGRDSMGLLLILAIMVATSGCRGQEGQEGEEEVLYYEDIESPEIRDNWESYPLGIKNQEKNKTNDIFNLIDM